MKIKKLSNQDEVKECAKLIAESEPWITLQRNYNIAVKMLNDPSREVYVGYENNEIVGFIILIMHGALVGYIQTAGVKPEWRNKGIGTKLFEFAEQKIFKISPNIFMCVSSFNKKAQRLYKQLGYEVIGELKDYIVPGHSEILLRKTKSSITEFKKKIKKTKS
jgi:ribosomal protein S18 acetylase RimI-like enzyme